MKKNFNQRNLLVAVLLPLTIVLGPLSKIAFCFFQPDYQKSRNTDFLDTYVPKQGLIIETFFYN